MTTYILNSLFLLALCFASYHFANLIKALVFWHRTTGAVLGSWGGHTLVDYCTPDGRHYTKFLPSLRAGVAAFTDAEAANVRKGHLSVGMKVIVRYNPANPDVAVAPEELYRRFAYVLSAIGLMCGIYFNHPSVSVF